MPSGIKFFIGMSMGYSMYVVGWFSLKWSLLKLLFVGCDSIHTWFSLQNILQSAVSIH